MPVAEQITLSIPTLEELGVEEKPKLSDLIEEGNYFYIKNQLFRTIFGHQGACAIGRAFLNLGLDKSKIDLGGTYDTDGAIEMISDSGYPEITNPLEKAYIVEGVSVCSSDTVGYAIYVLNDAGIRPERIARWLREELGL